MVIYRIDAEIQDGAVLSDRIHGETIGDARTKYLTMYPDRNIKFISKINITPKANRETLNKWYTKEDLMK